MSTAQTPVNGAERGTAPIDEGPESRQIPLRDRHVGVAVVLVALTAIFELRHLSVWDQSSPGPALLPGAVAVLLLAAGITLAVSSRTATTIRLNELGSAMVFFGLLCAAAMAFQPIGAPVTVAIFVMFELVMLHGRSVWFGLGSGLAGAVLVYVVFVQLLTVRLPLGWLSGWLQ